MSGGPPSGRRAEIAAAIEDVEARLRRACAAAGRQRDDVRLVAVTKTFPASDAALLAELGIRQLGENRDQEASAKVPSVAELVPELPLRWHMVGRLQRNKTRSVARWADEVQSVDSPRLADALSKAVRAAREAGERSKPMDVLVQLSLDEEPARGGCRPADLLALAQRIAELDELRLRGLMAVAPLRGDPDRAFESFATTAARLRGEHPDALELSAGMSDDLDAAIAHGSTCVRVGTALLGGRGLTSPL